MRAGEGWGGVQRRPVLPSGGWRRLTGRPISSPGNGVGRHPAPSACGSRGGGGVGAGGRPRRPRPPPTGPAAWRWWWQRPWQRTSWPVPPVVPRPPPFGVLSLILVWRPHPAGELSLTRALLIGYLSGVICGSATHCCIVVLSGPGLFPPCSPVLFLPLLLCRRCFSSVAVHPGPLQGGGQELPGHHCDAHDGGAAGGRPRPGVCKRRVFWQGQHGYRAPGVRFFAWPRGWEV